MKSIIFGLISFLIAGFAFGYGAVKLFKKKKPMYLQLLVCAAGCFAIQQLSYTVNIWCQVTETVSIGMLGIFGCNFFLLSANFGTLDKVVDDGRDSGKARAVSVIAPVIMAILVIVAFFTWKDKDMFCAVMWLVMLIPALPASYFNLKHILLPMDSFGFLRATKPCNIAVCRCQHNRCPQRRHRIPGKYSSSAGRIHNAGPIGSRRKSTGTEQPCNI